MSFTTYPSYVAADTSTADWLGEIPEHWSCKRLKRVGRLVSSKTDRRVNPLALENIEGWTGRLIKTEASFEGEGIEFEAGDVLFGKLRPYLAKVLVASSPGEAIGDLFVIRPDASIDPNFLAYCMRSKAFISIVDGSTYGSKMPRASWEFLGSMRVPVPTIEEQVGVVRFLERETERIDALVREQERLIDILDERLEATISIAVTRGIDRRGKVELKDSGVHWLGRVPSHWAVGSLSRFSLRVVVGIAEAATHAYVPEGVPILRSTNIRARRIIGDILHVDPAYAMDRGSKLIRAGDLVTVRTGNAGVTARIPDELDGCQCFTMLITTLSPECDSRYFEYVLNALPANRYFSLEGWGTAQTNISVPILKALPVAVPPLDEQRSICDYLDEVTIESRALRHEAVRAIELLVERRASLISSAVTGKIDVRLVAGQINPVTPDNGGRSASASLEAA